MDGVGIRVGSCHMAFRFQKPHVGLSALQHLSENTERDHGQGPTAVPAGAGWVTSLRDLPTPSVVLACIKFIAAKSM